MLIFPLAPLLNEQYSNNYKTWQWNGFAWDLVAISEVQVKRAEDAAALAVAASGFANANYLRRYEVVSPTIVYRGEAAPGSIDTALVWRIRRITITYGIVVTMKSETPNGDASFNHAWTERANYNYL